jgi:serine/threonine protein kinase
MNSGLQENSLKYCRICRREFDGPHAHCPAHGIPLMPIPTRPVVMGQLLNNRYVVLERIGAGGMGTIFRARDVMQHREVALKVLKSELGHDLSAVAQLYHEARAVRRLRHANIVHLESFGRSSDGHLYVAMELLKGNSLAAFLDRREPLPPSFAVDCARHIARALHAAHEMRVIHRDLKPENIQVVPDAPPTARFEGATFHCKVLDFGIASVLVSHVSRKRNETANPERISGTPAYMSPEHIMSRPVDARSDLYALGVLLFEMLSGAPPFEAKDPLDVCRRHLTEPAPRLRERLPKATLPRALETLVADLLKKVPLHRPQSAAEVLVALDAIAEIVGPPPRIDRSGCLMRGLAGGPPPLPMEIEVGVPDLSPGEKPAPLPPLVKDAFGNLTVMPVSTGEVISLPLPALMPEDGYLTLTEFAIPLAEAVESATLRGALWVCPSCSALNRERDSLLCERCGAPLEGPRTAIPYAAGGAAEQDLAWGALTGAAPSSAQPFTSRRRTPTEERMRVAIPEMLEQNEASSSLAVEREPTPALPLFPRREMALLHVEFGGQTAAGEPLSAEELRAALAEPVSLWLDSLVAVDGLVCHNEGRVLRVLFGRHEVSVSPLWLVAAVDTVQRLRNRVAELSADGEAAFSLHAAMVLGHVRLPTDLGPEPDLFLQRSPVDLATRLVRQADAGELQVNARLWRRIGARFFGQSCGTIHARGARQAELVYRVGARRPVLRPLRPQGFTTAKV